MVSISCGKLDCVRCTQCFDQVDWCRSSIANISQWLELNCGHDTYARTCLSVSKAAKGTEAMDWSVVCVASTICTESLGFFHFNTMKRGPKYPNVFHLYLDPGFLSIHSKLFQFQQNPKDERWSHGTVKTQGANTIHDHAQNEFEGK